MNELVDEHLTELIQAVRSFRHQAVLLAEWGRTLAGILSDGGRLLVAGDSGSAAAAQRLTAELVGKLRAHQVPRSALAMDAETPGVSASGNDYRFTETYARQVRAHLRPADVLLLLSTGGRGPHLLAATNAVAEIGVYRWAFTGPAPNPLAARCTQVIAVPSADSQVVQELHLVAAHLLCEYVDAYLPARRYAGAVAS
jgi:D-sedoheptulose 7-phosphate isomerase